ncbi:hypothetical protein [Paenibacillus soyae]|uniref:Uncharacterized protein n=1 Tax=Paenibacillus soyae TaxID=2969249 RepID=A0A9X2MQQ9_9BACL|nr:hypothetical protein [Paenibacillus soyae]MCR2805119.1 hypothetical protein [Paenibacillus soyae]
MIKIRSYVSELTPAACKAFIRDNLDAFTLLYGEEHATGWTKLGWFRVSYNTGKLSRGYWVFNKALGRISRRKGETRVTFVTFRGLTDPISIVVNFSLSSLIFLLAEGSEGATWRDILLFGGIWSMGMAVVTWLYSMIHPDGKYAEGKLIGFLERNIAHKRRKLL